MGDKERPGFGRGPSDVEGLSQHIVYDLKKIVENYIATEEGPEKIYATKLINIVRASGIFPPKTNRRDLLGVLSALLPDYGYSDTVFRRRYFMKMESKRFH